MDSQLQYSIITIAQEILDKQEQDGLAPALLQWDSLQARLSSYPAMLPDEIQNLLLEIELLLEAGGEDQFEARRALSIAIQTLNRSLRTRE